MRTPAAFTLLLLACVVPSLAQGATAGWGKRSQIGQLVRKLDAQGRTQPHKPSFVRRQPLLQKIAAFLRPGLSVRNDIARLDAFLKDAEAQLGGPVSTLEHPALVDGQRMRVEKAMALLAFGRKPSDVTETFVRTTAKVKGAEGLAERDLFLQHWKPTAAPTGKVFVISPGFLQTGRNFYEQAQLLNAAGHDVVLMDHQWAGYTADARTGVKKGGIDRGYGVARDVAEAAAYGNQLLEQRYAEHPGRQLVVVGTSMGGGPGVVGALKLYDEGRIDLGPGRAIPSNRGFILQGAFFARTRGFINNTLDFTGRIPLVRDLPLPATGLPLLNDDPATNVKIAAHAVAEDVRGRPQAFRASIPDLEDLMGLIARTGGPRGIGYAIHAERDHLADPATLRRVVEQMGRVELRVLPGRDHVIEETPGEQGAILDGARHVTR